MLNSLRDKCYNNSKSKGFHDPRREIGTGLMLITSELAEALEADRHGMPALFREEIADVFIRLFDFCGEHSIDIDYEVERKMAINEKRSYKHGKKY